WAHGGRARPPGPGHPNAAASRGGCADSGPDASRHTAAATSRLWRRVVGLAIFLAMSTVYIRPVRNLWSAMRRGALGRCPECGTGSVFVRYLKVAERCGQCGSELHHHRADDAPPYFTIFIVAHIVVPLCLMVERTWRPEIWVH